MFLALVCAADDARASSVQVQTVEGETITGDLLTFSLTEGLTLKIADGPIRSWPARELVSIRRMGGAAGSIACPAAVETIDGTRICGEPIGGDEHSLLVRHPWLGDIPLPLEDLTHVVFGGQSDSTDRPADVYEPQRQRVEDELFLKNGDRVVGTLIAAADASLIVETGRTKTAIPFGVLQAAVLAAPSPPDLTEKLRARLHLTDGSRLVLEAIRWEEPGLHVWLAGEETTVSTGFVGQVEILGGRRIWLSELTPIAAEHASMGALNWAWRRDRNVLGGPLRIAGRPFDRGLGVHSQSRLVYALDGRFQTLVVEPGVDDDSGPFADVTARIIVDGQVRFERSHLRQGHSAGRQRIDLAGAIRLELLVLFGENADVQDRFDWADAAFIRGD